MVTLTQHFTSLLRVCLMLCEQEGSRPLDSVLGTRNEFYFEFGMEYVKLLKDTDLGRLLLDAFGAR